MTEMRNGTRLVDLSAADALAIGVVGGKAAGLARVAVAGLPVPAGVVVPTSTPDDDIDAVAAELAHRFGGASLAVRSSAVAEDLDDDSYAGQYESVLDVAAEPSALADAIRIVRGSATAAHDRGYGHDGDERMAVLVMPMIDADAAGIAFTRDPVTGRDVVEIEAVAGVADQLASGEAPGERWVVDATPSAVEALGVLTADQASAVADLARRAEAVEGSPQDIEWAIADAALYLLQTRPITALPLEPAARPPEGQTWVRDDTHNTGPMTMLGFSAWMPRHSSSFGAAMTRFGLPLDTIDHELFFGRAYDRAVPVGRPKKDRPLPPAPVFKLLLRLVPPLRKRLAIAADAAKRDLPMQVVDEWVAGGSDVLRARNRELRAVDRSSLGDAELADHLAETLGHVEQAGIDHFELAFAGMILTGQLGMLLEELVDAPPERVVDLVQGHGQASAEHGAALDRLAAVIGGDDEACRLLDHDPAALIDHAGPGGEALRDHLDLYGHRVPTSSLQEPTWAEDPTPLLGLVRWRIGHPMAANEPSATAAAAEDEVRGQLRSADDVARFERALDRARRSRPYGDETEGDVFDAISLVRYIAVEAGRRLADRGALAAPEQVFHLSCDELAATLRGATTPDDIARREAEHRWALANEGPAVLGPDPGPLPSSGVFPASTADTAGAFMWAMGNLYFAEAPEPEHGADVRGVAASPGRATGPVRLIASPLEFDRVRPGDIVVCLSTMASWSPIFPMLAGIVTEHGGALSHPATLAREYGLPAVLSVKGATSRFADGQIITIDGAAGTITEA